jgi:glycerol-3-phosphate cytidylyltransferase
MRRGFIAGCFDPFVHPGVIRGWQQAIETDKVCDGLIVALHTDPSVERPEKSPPFLSPEERRVMLEAIKYVDEVLEYDTEIELMWLLETSRPLCRLLGDDYRDRTDWTGKALCEELGIDTHFVRRYDGWSGTEFRDRIQNRQYWRATE